MNESVYMTQTQLADLLSLPVRTVEAWRYRGEGPKFYKLVGAIRYRRIDVEAWIKAQGQ